MSHDNLRLPNVGEFVRGVGKLVSIEVPPPEPPKKHYVFEEIHARCELLLGDEVIKDLGELNDHYGLETGVSTAIKDMEKYAKDHNINEDSVLEVRVVRVVSQCRKHPVNRGNFYAKEFPDFESLEYGSLSGLPDPIETVAWSTKMPKAPDNATTQEEGDRRSASSR